MKVEQEKSNFKPITITLETKEEFTKVYYETGELPASETPMLGKIYHALGGIKRENRW